MTSNQKFYTVWKGKRPGVYTKWDECKTQVEGFEGAKYKSFPSRAEAEKALTDGHELHIKSSFATKKNTPQKNLPPKTTGKGKPVLPSISVDAACSGNPGIMEYQGVDTASGERLFHQGPFKNGTNNIGEFLALVHALAYMQKHQLNLPIYTDSKTARAWVRDKKIKTTLAKNTANAPLFELVERALHWLQTHHYNTPILTWDTPNWGEIPADFGRK